MEEGDGGGPEVGEDGLDMKAKECREPKLVLILGIVRMRRREEE